MGSGDSNTGSHACKASNVPPEISTHRPPKLYPPVAFPVAITICVHSQGGHTGVPTPVFQSPHDFPYLMTETAKIVVLTTPVRAYYTIDTECMLSAYTHL